MQYIVNIIMLFVLAAPVFAGGAATLESGGGGSSSTMKITWADKETLRMDTMGEPGYFIMRDGKAYAVQSYGGQTMVIDMAAMLEKMGGSAGASRQSSADLGEFHSVEKTGETETVAGVTGRVYHMSWSAPDGETRNGEAVLTDDPLVVEMTRAYLGSVKAMFGGERDTGFEEALSGKDRGLLRLGDQFRVTAISDDTPPAAQFDLPAEPQAMPGMRR